jgi:hypothetical protein
MPGTLSTLKRSPKPTKRYEEMIRAVQEQRLRLKLEPPARGKNAVLKARLLAAEPEVLPPPLPSSVTKTGYYGVVRASAYDHGHRNRKPYQARIPVGKASWVHLGSYDTPEEAGRHAAAAHNTLLEGSLPPLAEVPVVDPPPPPAKRRRGSSSKRKPTVKWTEDEDEQLLQILLSPEFDAPRNRHGGIAGGASAVGIGNEAYWRRVAEAMGYGNSVKGARRCGRRWWYLNPKNAERLEEKREHERERAKDKVKTRAASQKCLTDALDSVVFEVDEDPFESVLAVDEDSSPVEEAQDVIVRLSQLKEPIDPPEEINLYSDEVLSDITAERWSDVSDLDFLDDFENVDGFYEFHNQKGGLFKRVVKHTRTPSTKAMQITFTFRCSNLGRVVLQQAEQHRMRKTKYAYQKRYRELKKREAFAAAWRASALKTGLAPPTPAPVPPAPEPPPQDATLAPPLVQERMETYLKVCKAHLKTAMEEVDWAVVKATPLHATWEEEPRYSTRWSTVGIRPPMLTAA